MLTSASVLEFERSPVGRFVSTASCVVWCASETLVGWHVWGRPDEEETRTLLHVLAELKLAPRFDIVADTRGVEVVNPPALAVLVPWLVQHQRELVRRVRVQANVIRRDSIGFLLMGVVASLGDMHPLRTFAEPTEAFTSVAGGAVGPQLCAEVEAIVEQVRASPQALQAMRAMLAENVETTIDGAARSLGTSPRSLQRVLQTHGTSFHDEQTNARFALAQALLASDEKIATVAHRVGCSERTLTAMFRARTGMTPTEWRKRSADA